MTPWLERHGFEVFPEVEIGRGLPIADLVAVNNGRVCVFEGKTSLSAKLIRQAFFWRGHADRVAIVLPAPKTESATEERRKFHDLLDFLGIGLTEIDDGRVIPRIVSKENKAGNGEILREIVCKGHQVMGEAGSGKGERYTKYKSTIEAMRQYAAENPGALLKEVVRNVEHHYKSDQHARTQLLKLARFGELRGIRIDTRVTPAKVYAD